MGRQARLVHVPSLHGETMLFIQFEQAGEEGPDVSALVTVKAGLWGT